MKDALKGSVTIDGKNYEPVEYEGGSENRFWFAVPVDDATKLHDHMLYVDLYETEFDFFLISKDGGRYHPYYIQTSGRTTDDPE